MVEKVALVGAVTDNKPVPVVIPAEVAVMVEPVALRLTLALVAVTAAPRVMASALILSEPPLVAIVPEPLEMKVPPPPPVLALKTRLNALPVVDIPALRAMFL